MHRDMKNAYKITVSEPEVKKQFGTRRCREEDNIKMDLRKIGRKVVDCINLAHDRDQ
jgi:hypothetical protein